MKKTSRGILFEPEYRNNLERSMAKQLEGVEVPFSFEKIRLPYQVPARTSKYLPDFVIDGTNIILEGKGWFGRSGAKERQKFLLLKEQYPDYDIRFVFSDANKPLYKGSKTSYAEWADEHGFLWSTKGIIPEAWLKEFKNVQGKPRKARSVRVRRAGA